MTAYVYVDVEGAVAAYLRTANPTWRVVTELPANLAAVLPLVEVSVIGGADPGSLGLEQSTVDVDCYQTGRAAARALALEAQRQLRYVLPGKAITGGLVVRVATLLAPNWRPYDNTDLRRVGATYQITVQPTTFA